MSIDALVSGAPLPTRERASLLRSRAERTTNVWDRVATVASPLRGSRGATNVVNAEESRFAKLWTAPQPLKRWEKCAELTN